MQLCTVAVSWGVFVRVCWCVGVCMCVLCVCVGVCGVWMCVFVRVLVYERGQEGGASRRV